MLTAAAASAKQLAPRALAAAAQSGAIAAAARRLTTYSGGQPIEGQGGYYGSVKTRSEAAAFFHPGARAEPQDVTQLTGLMSQYEARKAALASSEEHEQALRQIASDQATVELLQRLIVGGAPAWGLSTAQREFVTKASRASA